jgi:hypothetical protein
MRQIFLVSLSVVTTICVLSCSLPQKVTKAPELVETKVEVYCNGPEYLSNSKTLRASAIGQGLDQLTSVKKALSEAHAGLGAQIKVRVKSMIDNYSKETSHQNNAEFSKRFESLTREVVNQELNGVRTICEKRIKTNEGIFKTYVCIELGGGEILNSLNNKLLKDDMLKIDYDYEKFKKIFEAEMSRPGK